MAYYAALVSVVQLLKEINNPQLPYSNSRLPKKHQIHAALYEKFKLVQELLEDYSPKHESADILEGQIRDTSYHALNIIESQISNHSLRRNGNHKEESASFLEGAIKEAASRTRILQRDRNDEEESASFLKRGIKAAANRTRDIIGTHISKHFLRRNRNHIEESASFHKSGIKEAADRTQDIVQTSSSNQELKNVEEEVGSILEHLMRIKMEKVTIHGDNMQGTYYSANSDGASTQAPQTEGVGGATKVQDQSGRSTTVVLDEYLITTIKGQICGEPSSRAVISIVGMGGLGKTTLARIIFDDRLIYDRFDCRAWVTASQDYHQQNILLAIVDSLNMGGKEELKKAEVGVLREQIYKHLKGRRYIIVVDDLWETKVWDDVNRIFPNDDNGSRVITTTRLSNVAFYADSSRFIHELQFLDEKQSWKLFSEKVFCPTELEDIGRLIAKNCRGLPLTIVLVAGLLSKVNKTRRDWEEIARDVSSATIGQKDDHLSKTLSLSYNHLPHYLKPCFLYLGGFPRDYDICVSELIWLWIADGLLQPTADKSLEEVGEEYVKDLVQRNLVLITEKKFSGKLKKCGIHDLLRDLCIQKACSERFFHYLHKEEDFNGKPVGDVHRFSVHMWRCSSPLSHIFKEKYISHVRSILCFDEHYDMFDLLPTASGFKSLRVFDTRKRRSSIFHEVVGELFHLRYLALRKYEFNFSQSIFLELQNLQTLILSGSFYVPSKIWEMSQLRHVKSEALCFPPIPFDEIRINNGVPLLGNLQTLGKIVDFRFTRDTVEMIPNLKKLKIQCNVKSGRAWEESQLKNLVHLRQLEVLSIYFFNEWAIESPLPENFAFPSTLIKLTLMCCGLPWKDMRVVGSLPNLQVLKLINYSFVGEEWEPAEGEFPKLRFLLMSHLWDLKYWRAEDTHFPCLVKLHIKCCDELLEIPLGIGDISTLQFIVVEYCNSSLNSSALEMQEEQQDLGNYHLHVRVIPASRPLNFASEDRNSTNASDDCSQDGNSTNTSDDWNSAQKSSHCTTYLFDTLNEYER